MKNLLLGCALALCLFCVAAAVVSSNDGTITTANLTVTGTMLAGSTNVPGALAGKVPNTLAGVTNALGLTGNPLTYLASDGTQTTPSSSSANWVGVGTTNSTLSGTESVYNVVATNTVTASVNTVLGLITATTYGIITGNGGNHLWLHDGSSSGSGGLVARAVTANEDGLALGASKIGWTGTANNAYANTIDLFIGRGSAAATFQLGLDAASPVGQIIKAPDGSGTDKNGGNLTLEAGQSTGAANSAAAGYVKVRTANVVDTGAALNSYAERAHYIPKWVNLTESTATQLFTFPVSATNFVGLTATVTVYATDGTDFQCLTTPVTMDAIAKTTTITTVGTPTAAQTTLAGSAGTLSVTYTFIDNGSNVASLKCNAVSSLTQTTLRAWVVVTAINSNGPVANTEL